MDDLQHDQQGAGVKTICDSREKGDPLPAVEGICRLPPDHRSSGSAQEVQRVQAACAVGGWHPATCRPGERAVNDYDDW